MNEYKFIPTPVFRDPILRYWIFLKGKILPIGYLVEDIGGVEVIVFKKENLALTDDIFKNISKEVAQLRLCYSYL